MKETVLYYKGRQYYIHPLQIEHLHTMDMFNYINIAYPFGEPNKLLKIINYRFTNR